MNAEKNQSFTTKNDRRCCCLPMTAGEGYSKRPIISYGFCFAPVAGFPSLLWC